MIFSLYILLFILYHNTRKEVYLTMFSNIEIEAKVLLTKSEYDKVYESLNMKPDQTYAQTNFYIDSPERILKDVDVALRIREKKGKYVLTMKTPLSEGLLEKN